MDPTTEFRLTPQEPPPKKDDRQQRFMELIIRAHKHYVKVSPMIGSPAGKNLKRLLATCPVLTEKRFVKMLTHYHESSDHARAESPHAYILKLPKYELGPLNKFGREDEVLGIGS